MINMQGSKSNAIAQDHGPSYTLNSMHGHDVHAIAVPVAFNWQDGPVSAPTLTASNDPSRSPQSTEITQQVAAVHEAASVVRRLTPIECCRLQGFPDDWNAEGIDVKGKRFSMADAPRYRQLGNAVTVNVANWIANNLVKVYALAP
jgi:site-specific DNA-cytosine methylase